MKVDRRLLLAAFAGAWVPSTVVAHESVGPVQPPALAPALALTDHLGRARDLREALAGKVTIVQTMFTGCASVCPIQGALFAEVQKRLPSLRSRQPVQLASLSVDALGDTPQALQAWLDRHQARPLWWAAVPKLDHVDAMQRALTGAESPSVRREADAHSNAIFFFDTQARLRWRSTALPSIDEVMQVARQLAA